MVCIAVGKANGEVNYEAEIKGNDLIFDAADYIAHTENIEDRLFRHTNSGNKSTKKGNEWKLIYAEIFKRKLKLQKGGWK